MPNPLDPIHEAFIHAKAAAVVASRCARWTTVDAAAVFRYTPFQGVTPLDVEARLAEAR